MHMSIENPQSSFGDQCLLKELDSDKIIYNIYLVQNTEDTIKEFWVKAPHPYERTLTPVIKILKNFFLILARLLLGQLPFLLKLQSKTRNFQVYARVYN